MTLKITWNVHEINLHLRYNWDLSLIDVCATQSWAQTAITQWLVKLMVIGRCLLEALILEIAKPPSLVYGLWTEDNYNNHSTIQSPLHVLATYINSEKRHPWKPFLLYILNWWYEDHIPFIIVQWYNVLYECYMSGLTLFTY